MTHVHRPNYCHATSMQSINYLLLLLVAITAIASGRSMGQSAGAESVNAALSRFDRAAMDRADAIIEAAIRGGKCPGPVLLVGRGDAILYERAYGNRALKPQAQPMTTDTVFDVASLTKPLATATSVMLLAER